MFAKQKRAALKYTALFLVLGGVSWISMVGGTAPDGADQAQSSPDVAGSPTFRPWGDVSEGAVDAAGIERNLDGNASALGASRFDWQ